MRRFCQVITTSPGRSASHDGADREQADDHEIDDDADHRRPAATALPSAASASAAKRRLASIAALRACALRDPILRRRARRRRQLGELGERAGEIGLRRPRLDALHDGGGIVAGGLVDRTDADEPFGIGLQSDPTKPPSRGAAPTACVSAGISASKLARERVRDGRPVAAKGSSGASAADRRRRLGGSELGRR